MIASSVKFVLGNVPAIMFVGAFVLTAVTKRPTYFLLGFYGGCSYPSVSLTHGQASST
jgi:hypothetical protein